MEIKLTQKLTQMEKMLQTLDESITGLKHQIAILPENQTADATIRIYRDSVIQRLEYCVDHFWKLLKIYLEESENIISNENGPRSIARLASYHGILSEQESYTLIKLIEERNKSSHMYQEEIANEIARCAPQGLQFMQTVLIRLQKKGT